MKRICFLVLVGLLVAMGVAFAGGEQESEDSGTTVGTGTADGGRQAPSLAALVSQGELPPLDERLPDEPMVVEPVEEIGQYGGVWRLAVVGGNDNAIFYRNVRYENLMRWKPDWSGVIPNIATAVSVSNDSSTFTFQLREGMRWSDGEPFTADDILFWFEAVASNEQLNPAGPRIGGIPLEAVEAVDDYTVVFRFGRPYGLFLQTMATSTGEAMTSFPRHYFEQFHADYNPDVEQLATDEGFDGSWVDLFEAKHDVDANPDQPTINAWVVTVPYDGTNTEVRWVRNPYYWKVDTEGNQLPYIDEVVFDVLQDGEVALLRTMEGQYDFVSRHVTSVQNRPVLFENMERGNYTFTQVVPDNSNTLALHFNYNIEDPVMRELIHNKDFRIGLSHAIDREEINDLVYSGVSEPWQVAPRPESAFFDEEFAKQYTAYDPELANEYLDTAGYTDRDREGFRLGPDGTRIVLTVEVRTGNNEQIDQLELIQRYWEDVGVDMEIRAMDRSLLWERKGNALHEIMAWGGDGGLNPMMAPQRYIPDRGGSHQAVRWAAWYNNPDDEFAEEPPESVKRQLELLDRVKTTGNQDRQLEYMKQALEIAKEDFRLIGTILSPAGYQVLRNDFHNVPELMPGSWAYPTPAPTNPEQYFTTRNR